MELALFLTKFTPNCRGPPSINKKNKLIGGETLKKPIRRKHKDNPYTIESITENNYIVTFKDGKGKEITVQINEKVYKALDRFELEDISEMHEYERHIEHSEIFENNLNSRAMYKEQLLEDYVIEQVLFLELKHAIELLPKVQKQRIKKYYFEDKKEHEIAEEENTTQQAVNKSLSKAKIRLKQILTKNKK